MILISNAIIHYLIYLIFVIFLFHQSIPFRNTFQFFVFNRTFFGNTLWCIIKYHVKVILVFLINYHFFILFFQLILIKVFLFILVFNYNIFITSAINNIIDSIVWLWWIDNVSILLLSILWVRIINWFWIFLLLSIIFFIFFSCLIIW